MSLRFFHRVSGVRGAAAAVHAAGKVMTYRELLEQVEARAARLDDEGVRVLVLCGRDEQDATMPTYEQVLEQMNEERVNLRARRYLRDLRRDAVIDFR